MGVESGNVVTELDEVNLHTPFKIELNGIRLKIRDNDHGTIVRDAKWVRRIKNDPQRLLAGSDIYTFEILNHPRGITVNNITFTPRFEKVNINADVRIDEPVLLPLDFLPALKGGAFALQFRNKQRKLDWKEVVKVDPPVVRETTWRTR